MKRPAKIEAPPPCAHRNAFPLITLGGHVSERLSDGVPIGYCPDCKRPGADVLPKQKGLDYEVPLV